MHLQQPTSLSITSNHTILTSTFNLTFSLLIVVNKTLPVVLFFYLSQFKILDFTLVLLFASVDFWLLKNIIGRKLVGMVWWMKVNQQTGDQQWIFHSNTEIELNKINEGIFWSCCLGSTIYWGFSTLISLLISRLFWISVCGVCLLLSGLNLAFFIRCRGRHQEQLKGFADRLGLQSVHRLMGES